MSVVWYGSGVITPEFRRSIETALAPVSRTENLRMCDSVLSLQTRDGFVYALSEQLPDATTSALDILADKSKLAILALGSGLAGEWSKRYVPVTRPDGSLLFSEATAGDISPIYLLPTLSSKSSALSTRHLLDPDHCAGNPPTRIDIGHLCRVVAQHYK